MQSLVGTMWKVVEARSFDEAGRKLLPLGPNPIGFIVFDAVRMIGALGDGRPSLPLNSPPRFYLSYTGTYKIDGDELTTLVDDASRPEFIVDQVRRILFENENRMVVVPTSGLPNQTGIEVVWEKVVLITS